MRVTRQEVLASLLLLAGFGLTISLGVLTGADEPPSRATSALLVVLAGGFQFAGAAKFHRIGKADPGLARAAVRRLLQMGRRAQQARQTAEQAFDEGNAAVLRGSMGRISVELSWIEEGLLHCIKDWEEFHEDALKPLKDETQ